MFPRQIFALTGSTGSVLGKAKFRGLFDCVFVSSRSAQVLGEDFFGPLLSAHSGAYVAVETGKFLVPLSQDLKDELLRKEVELAEKAGLRRVTPGTTRFDLVLRCW